MTSRKMNYVASKFGTVSGPTLEYWLATRSVERVAGILGVKPQYLQALLDAPSPEYPRNWVKTTDGIPNAVPYAGPAEPGFTVGPAIPLHQDWD